MIAILPGLVSSFRLLNLRSGLRTRLFASMQTSYSSPKQVIILAGATSAGKSAVARELCKDIDAEIVVADSVQIYKYLDIGSNKPSVEERALVPHHLLDICEPTTKYSSGDFVRAAASCVNDILSRGKTPIVVGGSTMCIQWLVHGIPDAPKPDDEIVEQAKQLLDPLEKCGDWDGAVTIASVFDAKRVKSLPRNDWYRMRRICEIGLSLTNENRAPLHDAKVGCSSNISRSLVASEDCVENQFATPPLTGKRTHFLPGLDIRCFFLSEDREQLYRNIDYRCNEMLHMGLFREVAELIRTRKITPNCMGAKAIGYRQTIRYLLRDGFKQGDVAAFSNYLQDFATATRNYSKRQLKWYRHDHAFLWLEIFRQGITQSHASEIQAKVQSKGGEKVAPYRIIADEIRHWCSQNRAEFDSLLVDQVACGEAVTQLRTQSRGKKMTQFNDYHFRAMRALAHQGEWFKSAPLGAESTPTCAGNSAPVQGDVQKEDQLMEECVKPVDLQERKRRRHDDSNALESSSFPCSESSDRSAQDIMIRASEGARACKALKEYVPEFMKYVPPDLPPGVTIIEAAEKVAQVEYEAAIKRLKKKYKRVISAHFRQAASGCNDEADSLCQQWGKDADTSPATSADNLTYQAFERDSAFLQEKMIKDRAYAQQYYENIFLADEAAQQLLTEPGDVRDMFRLAALSEIIDVNDDF